GRPLSVFLAAGAAPVPRRPAAAGPGWALPAGGGGQSSGKASRRGAGGRDSRGGEAFDGFGPRRGGHGQERAASNYTTCTRVFFCSETTCGQYAEIILTVGDAMLCGLAEPLCRAGIVGLSVGSLCIKDSQVMHCLGVAFAGGGHVEFLGSDEILFYPLALFEHACIAELGRRQALARGTLEPPRGFFQIGRHPSAFRETHADFVGGGWVAG